MAIFDIPTFTDPTNYNERVDLDGVIFDLSFNFNARDNRWYMDIRDADGVQLRSSLRLVGGLPLTFRWQELSAPAGDVGVVDPSGQFNDPTKTNIGLEVFLVYVEEGTEPE